MSDYKISVKSLKEMRKAADDALIAAGYDCLKSVGKKITVYLSQEVNIEIDGELAKKWGNSISNRYEQDCRFFDAIVQSLATTIISDFIYFDFKLMSPINLDIFDIDGIEFGLNTKYIPFDTLSVVVEETENKETGTKYLEYSFAKFLYQHNGDKEDEIYIFIEGIETQH